VLRRAGVKVLAEVRTPDAGGVPIDGIDGLLLKGNESGGFVGEDSSFILLQKWLGRTTLPLYVRGGLTPHVAAACSAVGVAGGVLDSQLLLMDEAELPDAVQTLIGNLSGSETVAVGDGERGEYFRILVRPGHAARARWWRAEKASATQACGRWSRPRRGLERSSPRPPPVGQDACFAAPWRKHYRHVAAVLQAIDGAIEAHLKAALPRADRRGAPLAPSLKLRLPIVQGR
jgi:hypothetical protein